MLNGPCRGGKEMPSASPHTLFLWVLYCFQQCLLAWLISDGQTELGRSSEKASFNTAQAVWESDRSAAHSQGTIYPPTFTYFSLELGDVYSTSPPTCCVLAGLALYINH